MFEQILQDRYKIISEIGAGGMGRVYLGEDIRLSQKVAIKETISVPTEQASEVDARIKAFQREAHLLAGKIKHSAIPRVIDYFPHAGSWYIVMEYIEGKSLEEQRKERDQAFSEQETLLWTDQLLKILDSLHNQIPPIIHRDIKPSNIKVKDNHVYLLDFGLAKQITGRKSTAATFLTPLFASPEQLSNGEITERSDLYSVAATMYCLLTNKEPVGAVERSIAISSGKPDPLQHIKDSHRELSYQVSETIMKALSFNPENRPASAEAMRVALQKSNVSGDTIRSYNPFPPSIKEADFSPNVTMLPPQQQPSGENIKKFWPKKKALILTSILGGLIVLIGLLILINYSTSLQARLGLTSPASAEPKPDQQTPREKAIELTAQALDSLYENDYEKAKLLTEKAIATDKNYALAHAVYGDAFWDADQTEEDSSKNPKVQISKGEILKIFYDEEPSTEEDLAARGWALLIDQKWDRAKQDMDKVLAKKSEWAWALMVKASVASSIGCVETHSKEILDAINTLKKVNSLKPKYAMAYGNLAGAYRCNKQNQDALAAYGQAINQWQLPKFYVYRGLFYLDLIEGKTKRENIENARKDFAKALEINPEFDQGYIGLARTHEAKEEYKDCIIEADKALSKKQSFQAYYWRSVCRTALASKEKDEKGFDEALENLEKANEGPNRYNDPIMQQNALASYYYQKAIIHDHRATYLLKEKYLKNKSSENRDRILTELENGKSAAQQALDTNQNKDSDKVYDKLKKSFEKGIRDFKKFAKRNG